MTILAAMLEPSTGRAYIASDSAGTGSTVRVDFGSKLVRISPSIVIGIASTYLLSRWLRETRAAPAPLDTSLPDFDLQLDGFCDSWRKWGKERGLGHTENDGSHHVPGDMLVATPSKLYTIDRTGAVNGHAGLYAAVGGGEEVALGSLHIAQALGIDARKAVKGAVEASIHHHIYCGGEVFVERVSVDD